MYLRRVPGTPCRPCTDSRGGGQTAGSFPRLPLAQNDKVRERPLVCPLRAGTLQSDMPILKPSAWHSQAANNTQHLIPAMAPAPTPAQTPAMAQIL